MKLKGLNICSFDPFDDFGLPKGTRYRQMNNPFISFGIPSPTYQTDFSSSTGWTTTGTDNTISGGAVNWNADRTIGTLQSLVHDMGSQLSDTKWAIKIKWHTTTKTSNTNNTLFGFGMSSLSSGDFRGTQDFLGFQLLFDGTTNTNVFRTYDVDGSSLSQAYDTAGTTIPATGSDYWLLIERTSSTSYKIRVYSDSTYSTLVDTITGTCNSTVQTLRYIIFSSYYGDTGSPSTLNGTADDLAVYDNYNFT